MTVMNENAPVKPGRFHSAKLLSIMYGKYLV